MAFRNFGFLCLKIVKSAWDFASRTDAYGKGLLVNLRDHKMSVFGAYLQNVHMYIDST